MNRRIFLPFLIIFVLASCTHQIPPSPSPLPPPTATAMFAPTSGAVQVETPGAQFYDSGEPLGFIVIPGMGDAGNYFLDAGSTVTLTWNDPPLEAARYDFILDTSGPPVVIGTDITSTDGISVQWLVPANLPGYEIEGTAYSTEGQAVYFAYGGTVYSGEIPPQDICTLSNNTVGVFPVHLEPNPSAQVFAELTPGLYVQVYERISVDWYRIDVSKLEIYSDTTLMCGESPTSPCRGYSDSAVGWVQAKGGVRFFGPCDQFSNQMGNGQNQNPVSPPVYPPFENPVIIPTIASPTEISPSSPATEQTGVRISGRVSTSDGSGLSNVRIFLSLAAYPGEVIATTDESGYFQSDLKFIPGDENITIWAELEGYSFTPSNYHWRHYYGYDERILAFTAVMSSSP